MTWAGYAFGPVEQGYLLLLSPWVSAFNAWSAFWANLSIYGAMSTAFPPFAVFGLPFTTLIIVLTVWSILMTGIEYII